MALSGPVAALKVVAKAWASDPSSLNVGDVLLSVNGLACTTYATAAQLLREAPRGDSKVAIRRGVALLPW